MNAPPNCAYSFVCIPRAARAVDMSHACNSPSLLAVLSNVALHLQSETGFLPSPISDVCLIVP